jgi:hypothetical protein
MSDNKSQLATFRIEPELWESFKAQARKNGKSASDVLLDFVKTYVAGGSAIAPTEAPQLDNLDARIDEKIAPLVERLAALEGKSPVAA